MVTVMRPVHLMMVVLNMRECDRLSCSALTGDFDPQVWAMQQSLRPGLSWAVIDSAGTPVACFGFQDEMPGVATVWMVATEGWKCHLKNMTRVFNETIRNRIYRRVQVIVHPQNEAATRFITRWLHFSLDGILPKLAANGDAMSIYSLTTEGHYELH